jgi:flagellar protein FlaG
MGMNAIHLNGKLPPSSVEKQASDVPPTTHQEQTTDKRVEHVNYSKEELEKTVQNMNKWLQSSSTHLQFRLHDKLNEYYVEIVNDQTNEVIRQIPSKKLMDVAAQMQEMIGLLVDEKR